MGYTEKQGRHLLSSALALGFGPGSRPRRSQVPELGQDLWLLSRAVLPAHLGGGDPGGKRDVSRRQCVRNEEKERPGRAVMLHHVQSEWSQMVTASVLPSAPGNGPTELQVRSSRCVKHLKDAENNHAWPQLDSVPWASASGILLESSAYLSCHAEGWEPCVTFVIPEIPLSH